MGETAQPLARRYPGQAETMIRKLGTEGLSAVRVYGDDVAEVVVKEGPESLGVLRKTGRGGWTFFTARSCPTRRSWPPPACSPLFLADPDKFVDYAGRATEYAVREFARAGVQLAGAVGGGAARGLEVVGRRRPGRLRPRLRPSSATLGMGLAGGRRRPRPRWSSSACPSAGLSGR